MRLKPEDTSYYVYEHIDTNTGLPFYIGRGKGNRAYSKERNDRWKEKVKELNGNYSIVIIKDKLTEEESYYWESHFIKKYGKVSESTGILINWTDGGYNEMGGPLIFGGHEPEDIDFTKNESMYKKFNLDCFSDKELDASLKQLEKKCSTLQDEFYSYIEEHDREERMNKLEEELEYAVDDIIDESKEYFRGGYPYEEVLIAIEDTINDLEKLIANKRYHEQLRNIGQQFILYLKEHLRNLHVS